MSFTADVKKEICKQQTDYVDHIAELSAIFRNLAIITDTIKVATENATVARHIYQLLKNTYQIQPQITVRQNFRFHKNYIYLLEIKQKQQFLLDDLSIYKNNIWQVLPQSYIIDDQASIRSYIRGLFLSTGSINDPKKSRYHLEFLVDQLEYAKFVQSLLNQFELNSKILKRENKYMIYIKEAEKIGDFLRVIGANQAVLYYEDIRIYRDHKNMTNRLNNCEQANVDKSMQTAVDQVHAIEFLMEQDIFHLLEEKEMEVAHYRMKYPEASLTELAHIITLETGHAITKSGLYHRFRKIKELYQKSVAKKN